jgi:hypothetical protein
MVLTGPCSRTPVSTEMFATLKVKGDFLSWLRRESSRRGVYLYELVEEITSKTLAGKRPWRGVGVVDLVEGCRGRSNSLQDVQESSGCDP